MNPVQVDVIVPAYNAMPFLPEAIESIRGQTVPPSSIIVVDDGSTDGTAAWLARQTDLVRHKQPNAGAGAARNRAIRESEAPILAFLDADDKWMPEFLEAQLAMLAASPETEAVFCKVQQVDEQTGWTEFRSGQITSAMVIRRSAFDRVGWYPETPGSADFFGWFLTARDAGLCYRTNDQILSWRRIHASNSGRQVELQRDYLRALKGSLDRRRRGL